jgi:AAA domain/RAP domain
MIKSYLAYLKEISRKIISDSGFEKAILDTSKKNPSFSFEVKSFKSNYHSTDESYYHLSKIEKYLSINNDKKLFCGFGFITGNKKRQYAAPILFTECMLSKDDNSIINLDFDFDTNLINYDLITSILNYSSNRFNYSEDDEFNEDFQNEINLVDTVEKEIKSFDDYEMLFEYALEVFANLQSKLEEFKTITETTKIYNCYAEKELFSKKPKGKQPDTRTKKSIFEGDLVFIPTIHLFVHSVPHQLTTYEAIKKLIQEVETNDFQNKGLKNLLDNVLTDKQIITIEKPDANIEEVIHDFLPFNFSAAQIAGIKNAFQNEISYIQGPPGTGKSFTIGAIVLCSLFLNKKILLISQKEPALDVIKDKIEPFLTNSNDDIQGITYFKKDSKAEIRSHIDKIKSFSYNSKILLQDLNNLENYLKGNKLLLKKLIEELKAYTDKLSSNLQKEVEYKEGHETFIENRDWFIEQPYIKRALPLSKKHQFKKVNYTFEDYTKVLNNIEKITTNTPTLANKFYIHKFRNHINDNYDINVNSVSENTLYQYSKDFLQLNNYFKESEQILETIKIDNDQLRGTIDKLKYDIEKLQRKIIKNQFKHNVLQKLTEDKTVNNLNLLYNLLRWQKPSKIADVMNQIDYSSILEIMPFWLAETRYLGQVLPMKAEMFDIIVVDESSQVNLAEVLPAFYRGKNICVVGDHDQLGLDSTGITFRMSKKFDVMTWTKYFQNKMTYGTAEKEKKLTVTSASILDFVRSPQNISIRTAMLIEHFRSMPALAKFTNSNFYDGLLRIMTETPEKITKECFAKIKVQGLRDKEKIIEAEAQEVLSIIKELTLNEQNLFSANRAIIIPNPNNEILTIGIISLLQKQKEHIEDLIEQDPEIQKIVDKHKIEVWTPQSAQGNERDIIIISIGLDSSCNGQGSYYKDKRRLNVATSRARKFTIAVYCDFKEDKYSEINKYLNLTANQIEWKLDHSKYESEFEFKVYEFIKSYVENRQDSADIRIYNQVETCGHKRLDFVLFNQTNEKAVAIEVDGSYHYEQNVLKPNYSRDHIDRIETLKRAGWNVINTPYYKWYRNGWLCDINHPIFKKEIDRINFELDYYLT